MDPVVVVGLAEWLAQRIAEWKEVAIAAIGLGVVVLIGATFLTSRMVVKTLTMLLMGAAVLWASANTGWLTDRVEDETRPAAVQTAPDRSAPARTGG